MIRRIICLPKRKPILRLNRLNLSSLSVEPALQLLWQHRPCRRLRLSINPPQTLAPGDERTWGMLAHLSTLLNLVTGFGGPIAALIIYLVYKDRSRFVAYHALQAMVFQLIWWFGGGVLIGLMWAIVGVLSAMLVGHFADPTCPSTDTCIIDLATGVADLWHHRRCTDQSGSGLQVLAGG